MSINVDDVLRKEAGCTTELDYTEQTSWLLFLKYLDGLEQDLADQAALEGKKLSRRSPSRQCPLIRAMVTTFWHSDGTPMSAQQFMELLFGKKLRYHFSIADAVADLGPPEEIGRVFVGFQKYLYSQHAGV